MSRRLFASTRKGLIEFHQKNNKWQIIKTHFLAEPVSMFLSAPKTNTLFAALSLGHFGCKLHRSTDNGDSWQEIAAPSYAGLSTGKKEESATEKEPSLQLIWSLEQDATGKLWAGTIPGGLFSSEDNGESWQINRPLWDEPSRSEWFGGGYDQPGIHSICIDPRNSQHISVAISCGGVWQSQDGGQSWQAKTKGMRADYLPPEQSENPAMQDPHRMVQSLASPDCFWVQHHNGIFHSVDNCATWAELTVAPSSFGFAVAAHPTKHNIAWFVPAIKDEKRIPVDGKLVVTKTLDGGKSFSRMTNGLPQEDCYDLIYRHCLAVDSHNPTIDSKNLTPDSYKVTGDSPCNTLAMGSTTGNLWISNDEGESWQLLHQHLPPIYGLHFC